MKWLLSLLVAVALADTADAQMRRFRVRRPPAVRRTTSAVPVVSAAAGGLTVSINDVTAVEGNSGPTAFVFTVTISAASSSAVSVSYATADGTAVAGVDYTAASGSLTFAPGETSKQITVNVTGDTTVEASKTFSVNLSLPTLADGQGVGTITNDDVTPPTPTPPPTTPGVYVDNGQVTIIATGHNNSITVSPYFFDATKVAIQASSNDTTGQLTLNKSLLVPVAELTKITLYAQQAHHVVFTNSTAVPTIGYAGTGGNSFLGGTGNDIFTGGRGENYLRGNAGDDTLTGGTGNNYLYGGPGTDALVRGPGPGFNFLFPD